VTCNHPTTDAFTFLPKSTLTYSSSSSSSSSSSLYVTRSNPNSRKQQRPKRGVGGGGGNNKPNNKNNNRKNNEGKRPNRSNRKAPQDNNNYNTNTILITPSTNKKRKYIDTIPCTHFQNDNCPGCIITSHITNTDIVRSAQLYFTSSSLTKHFIMTTTEQQQDFHVVVPSHITKWRTQAKLAVSAKSKWNKNAGVQLGLYGRGSHNVIPIPECDVHHPSINIAMEALEKASAKANIDAYQEDIGQGSLRYVQFMVERSTNKVSCSLVWNAEQLKECQPGLSRLVKEMKKSYPKLWHSIWVHCNDNYGNAIFSRSPGRWFRMDGPEFVRESLPGTATRGEGDDDEKKKEGLLFFSPMTFRQGNMDGFDIIAQHVAKEVPPGSKVCEMYAGVGLLGLTSLSYHARNAAASASFEEEDYDDDEEDDEWWNDDDNEERSQQQRRGGKPLKWLRCSDENPANPRCFERSLRSMPPEVTGRQADRFKSNKYNKKKGRKQNRKASNNNSDEITIEDMMAQMMANEGEFNTSFNYDDDDDDNDEEEEDAKNYIKYTVAAAGKAMYDGQALGADVLIVDPPRKGLDDEVLNQLCKPHDADQDYVEDKVMLRNNRQHNLANDVTTLIYVSCGFDALARDTDKLLKANAGWKIKSATGYVLFPGSNHVETVVIFKRRGRRMMMEDW